ncbi:MAG: bifunctional protein-serine/threonine kinase/phosphatase, partial [Sphingomonadaceae bacterium]|nr:bifunctional protein-serine/threonine kinase/phosphatase [Sphingomonadaceae bacterium]
AGDAKTDLFALGVTLYQWFTGKWPFGEQEAFQRPRFGNPTPPSHYRPEIPSWLDDAILTAIQTDPEKRFDDAIGLLRRLEGGGTIARREPLYVPLIERNPVRFWQIVSTALAVGLIFALVMR